jgi:DNA-binding NarL/FixJ family response regulator
MCSKSQQTFDQDLAVTQNVLNDHEYDAQRILNIIRRYHELRSAVEITAAQYGHVSGGSGPSHGKDDIMCMLADIDRGVTILSSRQLAVVELLKMGYLLKEIGKMFGIRQDTVKSHFRQAGCRIAAYLNTSRARKGWKR